MGARKCSKCSKTGHNSRTCRNVSSNCGKIMRLFGVELAKVDDDDEGLKLKNLSEAEFTSSSSAEHLKQIINGVTPQCQRKKGIPWSEEEHRLFLLGLEKLGKGNWRGISRNFVTSRTSTQVASHAQKYFLRRNNSTKNKFLPLSTVRRNEANRPVKLPEGPYFWGLLNSSAIQSSPSLELSLAAPPLPAAAAGYAAEEAVCGKKTYSICNVSLGYLYI